MILKSRPAKMDATHNFILQWKRPVGSLPQFLIGAFVTLIYYHTFVVRTQPYETIARVRAHLLHILYEIGKDDHQFRLRYKGEYLRDAYTVSDYGIVDNSIIKMVPLSKGNESVSDAFSLSSFHSNTNEGSVSMDVHTSLNKEVRYLDQRGRIIRDIKLLQYVHLLGVVFGLLTRYPYCAIWNFIMALGALQYCPTFSRTSGYMGKNSIYKSQFCIVYGCLSIGAITAAVYFASMEYIIIIDHGCKDVKFVDGCSVDHIYTAAFFTVHGILLIATNTLVWMLLWNMKLEIGDYIEKFLVQTRDIEEVMKAATRGRVKERRVAAFELATLAAFSDDNKFRIVAEGGLDVLISMALSNDDATQEHAVEAIAELLTIPSIQDAFVDMGGVRTLSALLHSKDARLVYEAAVAISYIVSDSEDNLAAVTADHGLDDLCHAAENSALACQRVIAGIFLDLAFNHEIRSQMASLNSPAKALLALCRLNDADAQRFALQTLELLAIESSDMICAQDELLHHLLDLPMHTMDERTYLLAGKILLYYAENRETCEAMLGHPHIKQSLMHYTRSKDPVLQKVIVKVIFSTLEFKELKYKALHLGLNKVLKEIRSDAADREAWDMADQALQMMMSDDPPVFPPLSTVEKINRMDNQSKADLIKKQFGSKASLSSTSVRSLDLPPTSNSNSPPDDKKGV